tara:strand:- start:4872 stop:5636 length:765 start_codon:yes stop_codon:yes gene_type:complete
MRKIIKILILGGIHEAKRLAAELTTLPKVEIVYSLAGKTLNPNIPDCKIRTGGFGGENGLSSYIKNLKFDLVIDATHPFATQIASNAYISCKKTNTTYIKLCRKPWKPGIITWQSAKNFEDAKKKLMRMGSRVFLTSGTKGIQNFILLENKWFLIRLIEWPSSLPSLENFEIILDRGPFGHLKELELLENHRINTIVTKNSGGIFPAKLEASHKLGIPILMIEQPAPPRGTLLYSLEETINWLNKRFNLNHTID